MKTLVTTDVQKDLLRNGENTTVIYWVRLLNSDGSIDYNRYHTNETTAKKDAAEILKEHAKYKNSCVIQVNQEELYKELKRRHKGY